MFVEVLATFMRALTGQQFWGYYDLEGYFFHLSKEI